MVIGASGLGSLIAAFTKSDMDSWLATWALVVLVGVIGGHNFAAPRYSLPAMLPIAVLIFRQNLRPISPLVMGLVGLSSVGLSCMIGVGERSYVKAAAELAETVTATHPPGYFSGEWTFRYTLRQAGWKFWRGEALCDQHIAVAFRRASGGLRTWTPVQQWEGALGSFDCYAKTRPATMLKPWDRCL